MQCSSCEAQSRLASSGFSISFSLISLTLNGAQFFFEDTAIIIDETPFKPEPHTQNPDPLTPSTPYAQSTLHPRSPNTVWVSNLTKCASTTGSIYLSPVMDLYDRSIIAFSCSTSPSTKVTAKSLADAFHTAQPAPRLMVHTDQEFQYRHEPWHSLLNEHGTVQLMRRKGNCYDDSIIENSFSHLKAELFRLKHSPTHSPSAT